MIVGSSVGAQRRNDGQKKAVYRRPGMITIDMDSNMAPTVVGGASKRLLPLLSPPAARGSPPAMRGSPPAAQGSGKDLPLTRRRLTLGAGDPMSSKTRRNSRREVLSAQFMGHATDANATPRFDVLTLRIWFRLMDRDGQGIVTSKTWLTFMRQNPVLRERLFSCLRWQQEDATGASTQLRSDNAAKECKRLLALWRTFDEEKIGALTYAQFVDFFRFSGNLLEYINPQNPRSLLADTLSDIWDSGLPNTTQPDDPTAFIKLCRQHLDKDTRVWVLSEANCEGLTTDSRCTGISFA
eukprot:NODE_12569_length_1216_cov_6.321396.p1 GENE.NODE_12569_length_1216_cov_6.321396~~NODE_12569_length_1216_cov_6.321396.p1  ORF type:complete len:296 (+),score=35.76 NODE_12569_length_1216_cov_6.321396:109-996(+)